MIRAGRAFLPTAQGSQRFDVVVIRYPRGGRNRETAGYHPNSLRRQLRDRSRRSGAWPSAMGRNEDLFRFALFVHPFVYAANPAEVGTGSLDLREILRMRCKVDGLCRIFSRHPLIAQLRDLVQQIP
jgi:hypothetical protein